MLVLLEPLVEVFRFVGCFLTFTSSNEISISMGTQDNSPPTTILLSIFGLCFSFDFSTSFVSALARLSFSFNENTATLRALFINADLRRFFFSFASVTVSSAVEEVSLPAESNLLCADGFEVAELGENTAVSTLAGSFCAVGMQLVLRQVPKFFSRFLVALPALLSGYQEAELGAASLARRSRCSSVLTAQSFMTRAEDRGVDRIDDFKIRCRPSVGSDDTEVFVTSPELSEPRDRPRLVTTGTSCSSSMFCRMRSILSMDCEKSDSMRSSNFFGRINSSAASKQSDSSELLKELKTE